MFGVRFRIGRYRVCVCVLCVCMCVIAFVNLTGGDGRAAGTPISLVGLTLIRLRSVATSTSVQTRRIFTAALLYIHGEEGRLLLPFFDWLKSSLKQEVVSWIESVLVRRRVACYTYWCILRAFMGIDMAGFCLSHVDIKDIKIYIFRQLITRHFTKLN